ncbi:MAG: hypothetical protein ACTSVY_07385 [Candidatus Helarchaeota archaeon]
MAGMIAGMLLAASHPALRLLFYPLFFGFEIIENLVVLPRVDAKIESWQNSLTDIIIEVGAMECANVLVLLFLPGLTLW